MGTSATSGNTPKRLLCIDGGGLCGLIPAQVLIKMEQQLNDLTGDPQPLYKRFDLIGGTSTGAILAAGLACGMTPQDLSDFYVKLGPAIFNKENIITQFWHRYPSGPIEQHLQEKLGERTTLGNGRLNTLVLLVTKNATLGNNWFFTNNPKNKFFATNQNLPLWQIVRASSAAPTFFPPFTMQIPDGKGGTNSYEFVDGGVSSYNNPALQVFLEATEPTYGLGWQTGVDNLLMISLGTGFNAVEIPAGKAKKYELLDWAPYMIHELMNEANLEQNILMHLIGEPVTRATTAGAAAAQPTSPEGTPSETALARLSKGLGGNKQLTYQRITIELTGERLKGLGLGDIDPVKVREMDAVDQIDNMRRVGQAVANEQVHMEELKKFF
jgi:patatin-like phospholipase/acyl hydrolase